MKKIELYCGHVFDANKVQYRNRKKIECPGGCGWQRFEVVRYQPSSVGNLATSHDQDEAKTVDGNSEDSLGWHVISGTHLLESLRRVEEGESADLVYAEVWANAEHESVE